MQKNLAIKIFNFYGINPAEADRRYTINYKKIHKIKIDKIAVKEKRIIKQLEGEKKMKEMIIPNELKEKTTQSLLEYERSVIKTKIESAKKEAEDTKPDMGKYKRAIEAETKTPNQQATIDLYNQYLKKEAEVEKLEKELALLEPFLTAEDTGKYNTKYCYFINDDEGEGEFITELFPSKIERASECPHDNGIKFFVDDQVYAMTSAKRVSDENSVRNPEIEKMVNTKAHEYHRILMLKSLYNIYLATGRRVFNVVVGTSLDSYREDEGARVYLSMLNEKLPEELENAVNSTNDPSVQHKIYKEYAEELKSKYISKSFVVRETGKDPVTLIINDLHVAPETITGATKVETDDLEHAVICDFGGLNESYLPIVNYAPVFDSLISNKHGMADKYKKIAQWIETRSSDVSVDSTGIEVMLNNPAKINEKMNHLIKDALFSMFDEMVAKLKSNSVVYQEDVTSIICIGGGAQVLAPYLKEYFSTVVNIGNKLYIAEENGIYANVAGMYDTGEIYFDQREYQRKLQQIA